MELKSATEMTTFGPVQIRGPFRMVVLLSVSAPPRAPTVPLSALSGYQVSWLKCGSVFHPALTTSREKLVSVLYHSDVFFYASAAKCQESKLMKQYFLQTTLFIQTDPS